MDEADAREMALALPDAHEQPHHGFPSFRAAGRIFATLRDAGHLNVMLSPEDAVIAVKLDPAFETLHWGQKVAGVRVRLADAPRDAVAELLAQAWRRVQR